MMNINEIKEYLQKSLSQKRYVHSLGVAEEAQKLAVRYGVDSDKAYLAGLVHDCAKEIPYDTAIDLMQNKYNEEVDFVCKKMPRLLHGPLGAYMARSEFGIDDEEIFDAIKYHTTGKADMSLFTKIIYMADFVEPNRTYKDAKMLREMTYENIDAAIIYGIDFTIHKLVEDGELIHPDTVLCRNSLV